MKEQDEEEKNDNNKEGASEMEVNENENNQQELASLKTRIEELVLENQNLKGERDALVQEKEQAARNALIDSRKKALEADFELEDLLDSEDEEKLGSMTDEQFTAYATKMKKIVNKSKNYKQLWKDGANENEAAKEEVKENTPQKEQASEVTPKIVTPAVPEFPIDENLKSKFKF